MKNSFFCFKKRLFYFFLLFFFSLPILASINDYLPQGPGVSGTTFGDTGLVTFPSARFEEAGVLKMGYSSSYPYEFTSISATPFPWLEAGFRYTEIKNEKYGPASYSGNQTNKDKGFDFKIRLIKESSIFPEIAIGLRDIGGSSRFASEYLVANKRFYNLDLTLGLAWGHLARDKNINNPLVNIADTFKSRFQEGKYTKGGLNYSEWFSGEKAAIFGGFEYNFVRQGFTFKAEYDTSNPDQNVLVLPVDSRINYAVVFPISNWLDVSLGYQRGNEYIFSFTIQNNYSKTVVPKLDPPKRVAKLGKEAKNRITKDKRILYSSLLTNLNKENIYLQAATSGDTDLEITINQSRFRNYVRATGRTARIATSLAPLNTERIIIYNMNGDLEMSSISFDKVALEKLFDNKISLEEVLVTTEFDSPSYQHYQRADFQPKVLYPEHSWSMAPALKNHIGGPESFYLGQLFWKVNSAVKFTRGLVLHTQLGFNIYNNFDQMDNPSRSVLPHVRSDIQDYLREGKNNIAMMKLSHLWAPRKDIFVRTDFGLLEDMFGGFGGEVLYRPFSKKFAIGMMAHKVKQRGFSGKFSFRDYEVVTGHLEFYYDFSKPDITAQLLVGKYLAGDKGATLDLQRRFDNGFTLGVFVTKTNVSAEEFGEGGFDKGFYFSIPTEVFSSRYQTGHISFGMHPITRDGGAILYQHKPLWGITGSTDKRGLLTDWRGLID